MKQSRKNKILMDLQSKGLLNEKTNKTLKELDDELFFELEKIDNDCKERIHNKILDIEFLKNGLKTTS